MGKGKISSATIKLVDIVSGGPSELSKGGQPIVGALAQFLQTLPDKTEVLGVTSSSSSPIGRDNMIITYITVIFRMP